MSVMRVPLFLGSFYFHESNILGSSLISHFSLSLGIMNDLANAEFGILLYPPFGIYLFSG